MLETDFNINEVHEENNKNEEKYSIDWDGLNDKDEGIFLGFVLIGVALSFISDKFSGLIMIAPMLALGVIY